MRILKTLVAAAAVLFAVPATATVNLSSAAYTPNAIFGGIHVTSLGLNFGGETGRFTLTGIDNDTNKALSFSSYCLDLTTALFTSVDFTIKPISSFFTDTTKRSQIAGLLVFADPLIALASNDVEKQQIAASIGLAIWEIVYETGNTGYTIGGGNFSVFGDFVALQSRADGYLANVLNGTWVASASRVSTLIANRDPNALSQDQIYLTGVPEPATWLTMILGFAGIGFAARTARRQRAALAA